VSFSDTLVFLSFLTHGPAAAVILSATETLSNCYYNKWKGKIQFRRCMIATNVAIGAISTTLACLSWYLAAKFLNLSSFISDTRHMITTLAIFAITQFVCSAMFVALFHSIGRGVSFWEAWKNDLFSTSMTQLVGAGVAGTLYEIIHFGDLVTMAVALASFGIIYFTYRQSISEINSAITKVQTAEREKAQTERERRKEVERRAGQLAESLEQQERANDA